MIHIVDQHPQPQPGDGRAARQWLEQAAQASTRQDGQSVDAQDEPILAVSPPPISWPRIFPSL
ncbi:MAG: hypothetical protein U1E23_06785 [Reyranellaceae bacterium]